MLPAKNNHKCGFGSAVSRVYILSYVVHAANGTSANDRVWNTNNNSHIRAMNLSFFCLVKTEINGEIVLWLENSELIDMKILHQKLQRRNFQKRRMQSNQKMSPSTQQHPQPQKKTAKLTWFDMYLNRSHRSRRVCCEARLLTSVKCFADVIWRCCKHFGSQTNFERPLGTVGKGACPVERLENEYTTSSSSIATSFRIVEDDGSQVFHLFASCISYLTRKCGQSTWISLWFCKRYRVCPHCCDSNCEAARHIGHTISLVFPCRTAGWCDKKFIFDHYLQRAMVKICILRGYLTQKFWLDTAQWCPDWLATFWVRNSENQTSAFSPVAKIGGFGWCLWQVFSKIDFPWWCWEMLQTKLCKITTLPIPSYLLKFVYWKKRCFQMLVKVNLS